MIVKTFYFEIAEQPPLGVMLEKNFTEPVYQKIGQVRALNLNGNFVNGTDGPRIRDQLGQRPRGILKYLRQSGAERLKSHVSRVLENTKARHTFAEGPAASALAG